MYMNDTITVLSVLFLVANVFAFLVMLADKSRARKGRSERISEGILFFLATAFGSIGIYAGMFAFRHKTRKWYFLVGIPLLFLQNLATLVLVYFFLVGKLGNKTGF